MRDQLSEFQRRIGVGETHYGLGRTGPTKTTPVIADDGPMRGQQVGTRTEHDSGRVDAKSTGAVLTLNPNIALRKVTT